MKTFKQFLSESKHLNEAVMTDEKILEWLKHYDDEYNDNKYKIKDGIVNSNKSIYFDKKGFSKIPFKFGKINGDFCLYDCRALKNLENFPTEVKKRLRIQSCSGISSLIGASQKVGSFEVVSNKKITSLDGCPTEIKKDLILYDMPNLKSLKGCPAKIDGEFNILFDTSITTLEGCPKEVGGTFDCRNTSIVNLKGISQDIHSLLTSVSLITYEQLKYLGNVKVIYGLRPINSVLKQLPNLKDTKFKGDNGKF